MTFFNGWNIRPRDESVEHRRRLFEEHAASVGQVDTSLLEEEARFEAGAEAIRNQLFQPTAAPQLPVNETASLPEPPRSNALQEYLSGAGKIKDGLLAGLSGRPAQTPLPAWPAAPRSRMDAVPPRE